MRENRLLIILITVILAVVIIACTAVLITHDNISNDNQVAQANNTSNTQNTESSSDSSSDNAQSSATTSSSSSSTDIYSVTFYSDGNPNTGETATIYLGTQNAGKTVQVSTTYYRDGHKFNDGEFATVTVDNSGNIKITDTTPMNKYPDECVIVVDDGSTSVTKTATLGTYKGSQTVNF